MNMESQQIAGLGHAEVAVPGTQATGPEVRQGPDKQPYKCRKHLTGGPLQGGAWDTSAMPGFDSAVALLHGRPLSKLLADYAYYHAHGLRRYMLGSELTRRGVPPSLRDNANPDTECAECRFGLFLSDAEWLATRYPRHKAAWERYQRLFTAADQAAMFKAASYLFYFGSRPPFVIVNGLGLTDQQQRECAWTRARSVSERMRTVARRELDVAGAIRSSLETAVMDGRCESWNEGIVRTRVQVWRCYKVAGARCATAGRFYSALTGRPMTRQNVHKLIAKIRRDLSKAGFKRL